MVQSELLLIAVLHWKVYEEIILMSDIISDSERTVRILHRGTTYSFR